MKFWTKAGLCTLCAATLVACGGGSDAPAPVAVTPTPATPATPTVSTAALTGVTDGAATAAAMAVDSLAAGYFGDLTQRFTATQVRLAPAAAGPGPVCSSGSMTDSGGLISYTNCAIAGATLNGVVKIENPSAGSYKVTFDSDAAKPFTLSQSGWNGKPVTYTYHGNEIISGLAGTYPAYTAGTALINATVDIGSASSVRLVNLSVGFSTSGAQQTLTIAGDYEATLRLSDFGVPAMPGVPDTVPVNFTLATPKALKIDTASHKATGGVYRMTSPGFTLEVDYDARKLRMIPAGSSAQEFDLV